MKSYKTLALGVAISSVLLATSFQANAATSIATESKAIDLTVSGATSVGSASFTVRNRAWATESMGYQGWTHFSNWGFVNLTKGKSVTIEVDATPAISGTTGLHPAISVWHRETSLQASNTSLYYMTDHSYPQSSNIKVLNATLEGTTTKVGNIVMNYVASAYDADNFGDSFALNTDGTLRPAVKYVKAKAGTCSVTLPATTPVTPLTQASCEAAAGTWTAGTPASGDQAFYGPYVPAGFNSLDIAKASAASDSVAGKVKVTFTAPKTGVYQFAIGTLKPDVGSKADLSQLDSGTAAPSGRFAVNAAVTVQ